MEKEAALAMHREEFYVKKEPVQCTVMTTTHLIEGMLHKRLVFRLMDELLKETSFLAMTNVTVHPSNSEEVRKAEFIAIRKD